MHTHFSNTFKDCLNSEISETNPFTCITTSLSILPQSILQHSLRWLFFLSLSWCCYRVHGVRQNEIFLQQGRLIYPLLFRPCDHVFTAPNRMTECLQLIKGTEALQRRTSLLIPTLYFCGTVGVCVRACMCACAYVCVRACILCVYMNASVPPPCRHPEL